MNLAHLHLMVNHLPVVGFLILLPLMLWALFSYREEVQRLVLVATVGIGLLALPAMLSGEGAEELIENQPGISETFIEEHEEAADLSLAAGLGTAGLGALALVFSFWRRRVPRWSLGVTLAAIVVTNISLAWTAYLGGQIRHPEIRPGAGATSRESQNQISSDEH